MAILAFVGCVVAYFAVGSIVAGLILRYDDSARSPELLPILVIGWPVAALFATACPLAEWISRKGR